jgi:hypothetical protein
VTQKLLDTICSKQFNYSLTNIGKANVRKLREKELIKNKDHYRARRDHLVGRMARGPLIE